MDKILILDGDCRNGLAVTRSLGRAGYECGITSPRSPALVRAVRSRLRSRYARRIHFVSPWSAPGAVEGVMALCREHSYGYLVAVGTGATNFLSRHARELGRVATVLVEDFDKLWSVHDKALCLDFARRLNLPMPRTWIIGGPEDLDRICGESRGPLVVKYPDSCGSVGLWTHEGGPAFRSEYLRRHPVGGAGDMPIVQERVDGEVWDATVFAVDGEPVGVVTQERVVTSWLDGGGGYVNRTDDMPPMRLMTERIVRELRWTGPMQVEFIREHATGRFVFLEINPKFFGTTQLSLSAGYDYPVWLLQAAKGERPKASAPYVRDMMYRWLPKEMFAVVTVPRTRARLLRELRGFVRRFRHRPVATDFCTDDIKPFLLDVVDYGWRFVRHGHWWTLARVLVAGQAPGRGAR